MSWNYSGNPADGALDECRFLIGDTNPLQPQLQDGEIQYALGLYYGTSPIPNTGNFIPAAWCCDALMSKFARLVDQSVGDLRISYTSVIKQYQELAARLRMRAALAQVPVFVGGESMGQKIANYTNPDLVQIAVKVDGMTAPGDQPEFYTQSGSNQTTVP